MTARTASPAKSARQRVLIVDDEESMRLFLARVLTTGLRLEVTLAGTCEQALRLSRARAYDLILLDLLMPGIGGYEVLREIRRMSANIATPVVIASALADKATQERCLRAGADGYVAKPIERNSLLATIRAQLAPRPDPEATRK